MPTAAPPKGLKVEAIHKNDVTLVWTKVDGARLYNVYRADKADGAYAFVGQTKTNAYTDATVLTTIPYYYQVASVNAGGISPMSEPLKTEAVTTLHRDMEYLDRAPVAVRTGKGNYIGWRMLGLDPDGIAFNVYRDGVKLNKQPIKDRTNMIDAKGKADSVYKLTTVIQGKEQAASANSAYGSSNTFRFRCKSRPTLIRKTASRTRMRPATPASATSTGTAPTKS
ncbi:Rhamnogalacturonan exolyase YesX [Paenibacillus sp. P1XP2]|nr:Rhamnogalacturonan exolyase YesX [Paenibacillus sp. P1XP2]